jgi:hypothetical protein
MRARAKQLFNSLAIDLLRPGPIEVRHGLGGPDVGVAHSSLEAAFRRSRCSPTWAKIAVITVPGAAGVTTYYMELDE